MSEQDERERYYEELRQEAHAYEPVDEPEVVPAGATKVEGSQAESAQNPKSSFGEASALPQLLKRATERLQRPNGCGCRGEYHDSCGDRALIDDLAKALAEARALSFSSGDNSSGGTTICPACVVSDPRIRLCDVHKGEASAPSSPLSLDDSLRNAGICLSCGTHAAPPDLASARPPQAPDLMLSCAHAFGETCAACASAPPDASAPTGMKDNAR